MVTYLLANSMKISRNLESTKTMVIGNWGEGENPLTLLGAILKKRYWVIASIFVFVVGIVAVYSFLSPPIYSARCRLLIEPASLRVAPVQDVYDPNASLSDYSSRKNFLNTQVALMQSDHILSKVFSFYDFSSDEMFRDAKEPLRILKRLIAVNNVHNTYLVDVSFDWKDPVISANVANYIAHTYVEDLRKRQGGFSGRGIEKLQLELQQMEKAREQAILALTKFKDANHILALDDAQKLLFYSISKLTEAMVETEAEIALLKASVQVIDKWLKDGGNMNNIPEVLQNHTISLFKVERLKAQARVIESQLRFDSEHRQIKLQQKIIESMDKEIAREFGFTAESVRLSLQKAEARLEIIERKLDEKRNDLSSLDKVEGRYRLLEDTVTATEESYRKVLKRINEIKMVQTINQDSSSGVTMVLVNAVPPTKHAYPKKGKNLMIAAFLGLVLGVVVVLLQELFDSTIKTKEQVEQLLPSIPLLGVVPKLLGEQEKDITLQPQNSLFGESFRTIRTGLGFSLLGREHKCFAITSSEPAQGKTTVSINLAISFAQDGKKVLLCDGDMRWPSIGKYLKISPTSPGLSNIVVGELNWTEALYPHSRVDNFDIITSGPMPPMPSELLGTSNFIQFVEEVREAYDIVIFDTPPCLQMADTSVLAGVGIPLLIVARVLMSDRKLLAQAHSQLQTIQGTIIGSVVNGVELSSQSYYG